MAVVTVPHLEPLVGAVAGVDAAWRTGLGGGFPGTLVDDDVAAMTDAGLLAVNDALAGLARRVQALQARVASGISQRSTAELGAAGLARKAGFRSPVKLIAASTGSHPGEAKKLIQVGEATTGRITFTGHRAPARHPAVAVGVDAGRLSVPAAGAISTLLDKVACRAERGMLQVAERTLVEQAAGLSLTQLQVVLRRAEAWLDPDGVPPRIENAREARYLRAWEDQHGMINLDGRFDPATGAPIKTAIDALVTAQIRALRGRNNPDTRDDASSGGTGDGHDSGNGNGRAGGAWAWSAGDNEPDATNPGDDAAGLGAELGAGVERRTVQQLQADALAALAKHSLGCAQTALPLAATTVIVRIPIDALTAGTGIATIDGLTQPVDAGTARRMAADAEIIPHVLGGKSEVLDHGRSRRLFTKAQRLALWERDGGCAGCGAPPGMTEAHHLNWWSHGGATNLNNGILLCSSCHHTIHKHDWDIRINGPDIQFIPPAHIDPTRTPRPGGRARHDYADAA